MSFGSVAPGPAVNAPGPTFEGYQPADIQAAYGTKNETASPLVAIIDFGDDPTAETDLGQYRSSFGLPACTTANGCFTKVNQTGGSTPPPMGDADSIGEISLDLDAVSAVCPHCHLLLVEADSSAFSDVFAGADEAVTLGAKYVSMSFGASEGSIITAEGLAGARSFAQSADSVFDHAGVTFVASTGDDAFHYSATTEPLGGLDYPASSPDVVAAGGVSLNRNASSGAFSETAWSWDPSTIGCMYTEPFNTFGDRCAGAGSGCSQLEPAQPWQQSTASLAAVCSNGRAGADVSADADPATGLLVDVDGSAEVIGGTSLAAPLLTSLYGQTGERSGSDAGAAQSTAYRQPAGLVDVTSGSTGSCGNALCTSGARWDGPTGLGTPNSPNDLVARSTPKVTPTVTARWPSFRFGTTATVKVSVRASVAPTGTVTVKNGSAALASKALTGSGTTRTASLSVGATRLAPGRHALTVSYSGNAGVAARTLAPHTVTVAKALPRVTVTWPRFSYGARRIVRVAIRASVTPLAAGTLTLKWRAIRLARAHLPGGSARSKAVRLVVHTSKLTAGRRALTVVYSGDKDVAAKTLAAHRVTVTKASPTVTATWPRRAVVTRPFSVKVRVRAAGALAGTVRLKLAGRVLKTVHLPKGTAAAKKVTITLAKHRIRRGRKRLIIVYSGDTNVAAHTLRPHTLRVV